MKNKYLIFGVVGLLLLTVGAVGWFKFLKPKKSSSGVISPLIETGQKKDSTMSVVWQDPAGFKFSYPSDLKIDTHPEDALNYSHLEITSEDSEGSIVILMKDTSYQTIEAWTKKEVGSQAQVLDSQLGGKAAKKVAYASPKKLLTATIDVDVLVTVEGIFGSDSYWQDTYNGILSSFEFTPLAGEPKSLNVSNQQETGGAAGIIEEPEEVIE